MDEMLYKELIKQLRSERCWSQEQLSLIAGLSLRTIQRIESEGRCSFESKKAIASALNINIKSLTAENGLTIARDDVRLAQVLTWVGLIDSCEYEKSWEEAGTPIHRRVSRCEWVGQIKGIRGPLGYVLNRTLRQSTEHETLPGAPDGNYVILVFYTVFEKKQQCAEKFVIEKTDNEWKVVGYFIH